MVLQLPSHHLHTERQTLLTQPQRTLGNRQAQCIENPCIQARGQCLSNVHDWIRENEFLWIMWCHLCKRSYILWIMDDGVWGPGGDEWGTAAHHLFPTPYPCHAAVRPSAWGRTGMGRFVLEPCLNNADFGVDHDEGNYSKLVVIVLECCLWYNVIIL